MGIGEHLAELVNAVPADRLPAGAGIPTERHIAIADRIIDPRIVGRPVTVGIDLGVPTVGPAVVGIADSNRAVACFFEVVESSVRRRHRVHPAVTRRALGLKECGGTARRPRDVLTDSIVGIGLIPPNADRRANSIGRR